MNKCPAAKRVLMFIFMCCLSVPPVFACSNKELKKYAKLDDILVEYKELYPKFVEAYKKTVETDLMTDAVRVCKVSRELNNLSLEWLGLDQKLERACPVFYVKWVTEGEEARDMFGNNQVRHQSVVDNCMDNELLTPID